MNAAEVVKAAVSAQSGDLYISSLGTATSALRAAAGDAAHLYLGGAMGSGLAVALGVAERCPDHNVTAILGDGELLMGANALWSMAGLAPQNLLVVILHDGRYAITGGQPLISDDLFGVLRGFSTLAVSEGDSAADITSAVRLPRPRILIARVTGDSPQGPSPFVDPRLVPVRFANRVAEANRHA